ncbi:MAG: hypothetical protein DWB48_03380 [Nitrosomonas sp.]|nr:hypothetical protein [Nitrosomonas sp.]
MPNLPALPDMGLPAVTSNLTTTLLPGISSPVVPGQPIEQAFGSILISMMKSDQAIEDDTENPAPISIDALIAGMMAAPANPPQLVPSQPAPDALDTPNAPDTPAEELLSMLATTTVSNTGQPVADKPVTFLAGELASATPINLPSDPGRHVANPLQATSQAHAAPLPAELPAGNISTNAPFPAPVNSFNQAIDAANFADSGKSLPPSMTSVSVTPVAAHISSTPLTDTAADTTANDAPAIAAEFGQPDWPEEFGRKITWLATQRMQTAELKLHPAHLGPIEISLQLSDDQRLTAQFISHHPAVREAIEANLPRLREIMAENGITLADTSVSADTPGQQAENGQGSPFRRPAAGDHSPYDSTRPQTPALQATRRSSLIDTFA